ncbi:hypothetical protein [Clostridium oryzae]|uniref:Uncharacterized protein n=1 Tax=Clostridium oryzae TaxID=1450648 RepID=A0A1V4IX89_9CLOT|nr:hypothetical protein [Clostridium oryzae]OPJ64395.1 hypothetical protein CLORY_05890 [Clostridium oryzae]
MNVILLIFIILATTFLAISMNNLISISRSVNYFMEKAKTLDYVVSVYDRGKNEDLYRWLNASKADGRETHLKSGEVAFSMADKSKNNLKIGDKIVITLGDIKKLLQ